MLPLTGLADLSGGQQAEYTWITLVFETKGEAEAAHSHAAKAIAHAKALKIVSR
jgi:hypothetical protein